MVLGMPKFVIRINPDYSFCCYFLSSPCTILTLSRNNIKFCSTWSILEEIVRYLNAKEIDHQTNILIELLSVTGKHSGNKRLYSADMIARCFEYYACSRALYSRLLEDFKLPCIRTLQKITSKGSNLQNEQFMKIVFDHLEPWQKRCTIMLDEVYVKPSLTLHGGRIFGKAIDHKEKLAKTLLSVMLKCLFGGPSFMFKCLPVSNLDSKFLSETCNSTVELIEKQDKGQVIAIITDGHKVNQKTFDMMKESPEKPWKKKDSDTFLLYDYVHIMKCIRNNWYTEKTKELEYTFKGKKQEKQVARWSDLQLLFDYESEDEAKGLIKLSKLDRVSVNPKPIERQRVQHCLNVFSEETLAALKSHSKLDQQAISGTITFIEIFVKMWKIFNVKSTDEARNFNDPLRAVVRSMNDERFQFLEEIAQMAKEMSPKGRTRQKSFTADTSKFIHHNCYAFVDLAKYLLSQGNAYVMFGLFSTDYLEKSFGKLRQGSGGTYFITVQNVLEKLNIEKAKLCLQIGYDLREASLDGHHCEKCNQEIKEHEADILENLDSLENSLSSDVLSALLYVSGYIQKTCGVVQEFDSMLYYDNYGIYLDSINRGKLTIPYDTLVQWVIFSFILFTQIPDEDLDCRNNISNKFFVISELYDFNVTLKHCRTFANILINNKTRQITPKSTKEANLKVLKLS